MSDRLQALADALNALGVDSGDVGLNYDYVDTAIGYVRWENNQWTVKPNAVIARTVETCAACPSQWNAWTPDGRYLYLRYRNGIGTVDAYEDANPETWDVAPDGAVARFDTGDRLDGCIELADFCARAGLRIAEDATHA